MNITIREAQLKDLFEISLLAKEAYVDYKIKFKFNPVYFYEKCEILLKIGGHILIAESEGKIVGSLGFLINQNFFFDLKVADEIFWYSNDMKCGILLFKKFESFVKEQGCGIIKMALIITSKSKKLESFYLKKDYELFEKTYLKEV